MDKITNIISELLSWLCIITVAGLAVIMALQVTTRWMGISLAWTEELARFFLVWLTFAGCVLAIKDKSHLSVNFFVNLAPRRLRLVIGILVYIIMVSFFALLMIYGFQLSSLSMKTLSSTLRWPMGLVYGVLPVTAIMGIYFLLLEMGSFVRKGGDKL